MSDETITYQTPHGALLGLPEQPGGLWRGVVIAQSGDYHAVVVIREEADELLVSGPTFFGWVWRGAVIPDAD